MAQQDGQIHFFKEQTVLRQEIQRIAQENYQLRDLLTESQRENQILKKQADRTSISDQYVTTNPNTFYARESDEVSFMKYDENASIHDQPLR